MSKVIEATNLQGERGMSQDSWNAQIEPGKQVRIFGAYANHVNGPQKFDLTFKVGERAVYGSYNLTYTGIITNIGEKTVTIKEGSTSKRLQLRDFMWRNWDYDIAKIRKRNSEWMD